MFHSKFFVILALVGTFVLSACSTVWETDYSDVIDPQVAKNWHIAEVDVRVPQSLTVSERYLYAPNADIVWRGDPVDDSRHEQVAAIRRQQVDVIMTNAVKRGTKSSYGKFGTGALRGKRPVKLVVIVQTFHALSDKARTKLKRSGVHNIVFTAQIVDARTGAALTPEETIKASLFAYVGDQAIAAERQGQTQKVRISNHVSDVIAGWLGHGPDVRDSFTRRGR